MAQSEDQPASEEAPIFLHTSSRSYQVKGESFTPPKSSKTHTLPLGWLEETLQSEPTVKLKSSKTRPFPFPEDQQHEQTTPPGREAPPFPPSAQQQQGQTPIPPPLPKTPSTPVNTGTGEVPPWLVSVVASLEEEQEETPEGHKAWKKRTLLIVLGSVVLVAVAAVVVFLLSSRIL